MSKPNYYIVETIFGKIELAPTSGDHIYVSFGSQYDNVEPLTVRGVSIRGSAHFYRYNDGHWEIGPEYADETRLNTIYDKRMSLHLTRYESFLDGVSEHARKVIHSTLTIAIADAWVYSKEGKAALSFAAEQKHLEDIEKLSGEILALEKQAKELRVKRLKLLKG